ncbi:putative transmembrane protein [Alcanivorax sp. S71-1-4]|uniref:DUF3325 domain-containing protein n=1 Tax=Alcanivorax sp. S71-1-4 TaxID=1177159 RepID=UPI00135AB2FC|nr:DUF3325 domain-containing protein [Alcanivorax sp. S71-1-4]KAF0810975.1 putative transmembrane protein [Alcanivorax sp. S71-1-4]
MILLASLLTFVALLLLCMAMRRSAARPGRHRQVPPAAQRQRWRLAGMVLLVASLGLCAAHYGFGAGLVCWFCLVSASGLVLVFCLPYRDQWQQARLRRSR